MTMSFKITLAIALAFIISHAVSASAGPRTCGYSSMQYSGDTWTGPYCH
jgi:hypothetical protein